MKYRLLPAATGLILALSLAALSGCQTSKKPPAVQTVSPQAGTEKDLSETGRALYHFSAAQLKENAGDPAGAIEELKQSLTSDSASDYLHLRLADLLLKTGKAPEAEAEAKAAVQLAPQSSAAADFLAVLYLNSNRAAEAQALLEPLLARDPDYEDARLHLTMALLGQGFPGPAVENLRGYLKQHPNSANAHYFLGQVLFKLDRYQEAIAEYEEALRIQPAFYYALQELGQSYMLTKQKDQGVETFTRLLSFYPGDNETRNILANTLVEMERWDQALAVLAQGKAEDDSVAEWWLQSGFVYLRQKKYEPARAEYNELLKRDPKNEDALFYLGVLAQLEDQPAPARGYFEKIPKESSRYPDARRRIAWSYKEEGDRDKALDFLKQLSREMPQIVPYYLDRAALYQEAGQLDLALGVLMEGLQQNPGEEDLTYQVGVIYDLTGDHDLAVAQMEKILEKNPKSARALNFIGYSYADRGIKLAEAEKLIRQALAQEPDSGAIQDSLGWVFYQRKQYVEALKWLHQAIKNMPEDPEISAHLGDVYSVQGQKKRALEYYQKALDSLKDNPRPGLAETLKTKIEKLKGK